MKNKPGRPVLTLLEKLRRKTLRAKLAAEELQREFEKVGDTSTAEKKPGPTPKKLSEKVADAWSKVKKLEEQVREQEAKQGIEHVNIDDVHDPLVENNTVRAVGRPGKNELTMLDRVIEIAEKKLKDVMTEWSNAGSDMPAYKVFSESGKPIGRRPKSYRLQVRELKQEIKAARVRMVELEKDLSLIEKMKRQIKLLRDTVRRTRKEIKKADAEGNDAAELNKILAQTDSEIKIISARVDREAERQSKGFHTDTPVSISHEHLSSELLDLAFVFENKESCIPELAKTTKIMDGIKTVSQDVLNQENQELERYVQYKEAVLKKMLIMREIEKLNSEIDIENKH